MAPSPTTAVCTAASSWRTSSFSSSSISASLSLKSSIFGFLPTRLHVSLLEQPKKREHPSKHFLCFPQAKIVLLTDDYEESPEETRKAYEALYGPAFSKLKPPREDAHVGFGAKKRAARERIVKDNMEEKVVQIRRVTKVVKGGKQLSFRAIVVVGDKNGTVGVGLGKAKEIISAVQKSASDARRHVVTVPMTKQKTFPHRANGNFGAAKVMLRPAAIGTGVIAGGSVRVVLELAGVVNALGKELGSKNPLNNARATIEAISSMRHLKDVAQRRGIPLEELLEK